MMVRFAGVPTLLLLSGWGLAPMASPAEAQPAEWRVGQDPLVMVGTSVDDPRDQLDRVSAAVWLGARGLVIANGGEELRYHDAVGAWRTTSGRSGDGPGDFRSVTWLAASGDSLILAYDQRLQRVSFLDLYGAHLRSFPLNDRRLGVAPEVAGLLDQGLLTLWRMPPLIPERGGLSQRRFRLALHALDGEFLRVLGEGPAGEAFVVVVPGRGNVLRRAPFSPTPRYAAQGERIYRADGVAYAVDVVDLDGRLQATAGDPNDRVELSDAMKEAFLRDTLRTWPSDSRRRMEAAFRLMLVHGELPLVHDMRVDRLGHVWLRRRGPDGPLSHWDVFSAEGARVARVELPEHRAVLDVTEDAVVLLQSGSYGEDLVGVYALSRASSPD
jgi:hypothetical protein